MGPSPSAGALVKVCQNLWNIPSSLKPKQAQYVLVTSLAFLLTTGWRAGMVRAGHSRLSNVGGEWSKALNRGWPDAVDHFLQLLRLSPEQWKFISNERFKMLKVFSLNSVSGALLNNSEPEPEPTWPSIAVKLPQPFEGSVGWGAGRPE